MFNAEFGGQISWLLPAALILLVAAARAARCAGPADRPHPRRAPSCGAAGCWSPAAVFSLGQGIIHPYYTVALAPAIGAVVGIGGAVLWRRRTEVVARVTLAVADRGHRRWAYVLLDRTPSWLPVAASLVLVARRRRGHRRGRRPDLAAARRPVVAGAGIVAALAGPTAYTLSHRRAPPHTGAIPTAGPAAAGGLRRRRRWPGGPGGRGRPARRPPGAAARRPPAGGQRARPAAGGGQTGPGQAGADAGRPGAGTGRRGPDRRRRRRRPAQRQHAVSSELVRRCSTGSDQYTWVAATVGANQASGYQLATGDVGDGDRRLQRHRPVPDAGPVPAVRGRRPHPLLHRRRSAAVAAGRQRHGQRRSPSWVEQPTSPSTTVGGVTLYDLTATGLRLAGRAGETHRQRSSGSGG